jgi:hypothetical protein
MHNFYSEHYITDKKEPAGGICDGLGFTISWQRGELKFNDEGEPLPNGANPYDVISGVNDKLKFIQTTKFNSEDVKKAKKYLAKALIHLANIK